MRGRAWKLGDNISTDHIIPGRFAHLRSQLEELARHTFEDIFPDFREKVQEGDFIVAGHNFGQGSSREHAALVLRLSGIKAVLAKSAARIFFRNAFNIGLPILICNTDSIDSGDLLEVNLKGGLIRNLSKNTEIAFRAIPEVMLRILEEGGLIPYVKKYGGLGLP